MVPLLKKGVRELSNDVNLLDRAFLRDQLRSRRLFLYGLTFGVLGNLVASYLVELHFAIGGRGILSILAGLFSFGVVLWIAQRNFEKRMIGRMEKRIDALVESLKKEKGESPSESS